MRKRAHRYMTILVTLAILLTGVLVVAPSAMAATKTTVELWSDGFETPPPTNNPASGWTLGTESARSPVTWDEVGVDPLGWRPNPRNGSWHLWCAAGQEWQIVRDEYEFTNDEDGGGPNDPVSHFHGGTRVRVSGIVGSSSTDRYVDLDYFLYRNPLTGVLEKVEENDGRVTYSGSWTTTTNASYSGGSAKVSNSTGAYAQLYVQGSLPNDDLVTVEINYVAGHIAGDRGKAQVYHAYSSASSWTYVRLADLSTLPYTYANYMDGYAARDVTLTSDLSSATVSFWYQTPGVDHPNDFCIFEVSTDGGATWGDGYGLFGAVTSWTNIVRPLTSYIPGSGQPARTIKIRWRWHSNNKNVNLGTYIDDVVVRAEYGGGGSDSSPPTTPVVTAETSKTTNLTQLKGYWSANDPESGIAQYQYSVGTSPGGTNVVGWTSAGTAAEATITISPRMEPGSTYYVNARAQNGAGLWGGTGSSGLVLAQAKSSLSLLRNASLITHDDTVTLSGTLQSISPTATPLQTATQMVYVQQKKSGDTWRTVSPGLPTNVSGFYSFSLTPTENAAYRTIWAGEGVHSSATSPEVTVNVAAKVTLNLSRTYMVSGRTYGIWAARYRAYRAYYLRYRRGYYSLRRAYLRTRSARYRYYMYRYLYYYRYYYRLYVRYLYIVRKYSSYRTCTMSGDILPAHDGKTLTIMYKYGDWRPLMETTTSAGAYSETWAPYYPGTFYVRTHFPADDQNAEGYSMYYKIVVK